MKARLLAALLLLPAPGASEAGAVSARRLL